MTETALLGTLLSILGFLLGLLFGSLWGYENRETTKEEIKRVTSSRDWWSRQNHKRLDDIEKLHITLQQECDDSDSILRCLGLEPEWYRSEGGRLLVSKIVNKINERKKQ